MTYPLLAKHNVLASRYDMPRAEALSILPTAALLHQPWGSAFAHLAPNLVSPQPSSSSSSSPPKRSVTWLFLPVSLLPPQEAVAEPSFSPPGYRQSKAYSTRRRVHF